jgi:ACR3 family arsenite efflux pump ArsB
MIAGVLIGYYVSGVQLVFATVEFSSVQFSSIPSPSPITVVLLVMMYPVLYKLHCELHPGAIIHTLHVVSTRHLTGLKLAHWSCVQDRFDMGNVA